jgi:hypothetical protein
MVDAMQRTVTIERFLEQRDVDAGLYLLSRLLGLDVEVLGDRRERLESLKKRLESSRHITQEQKQEIVSSYREVIG